MMNLIKKHLLLFLVIIQPGLIQAQKDQFLFSIIYRGNDSDKYTSRLIQEFKLPSKKACFDKITEIIYELYEKSYITARLDSINNDSNHSKAYIYIGPHYELAFLRKGNVEEGLLDEVGYRKKLYNENPFNYKEVRILLEKIITYCENNGYPFASIKLDSILVDENTISASLQISRKNKITIDSIIIKGNATISNTYLQNYLGIKHGDLYNELAISKIQKRLQALPFLIEVKPPMIGFSSNKARIILYYNKKKANQFDGIIGVLPNNEKDRKLLLTGDIKLNLLNSFAHGELVELNWKSHEQQTQRLFVHFNYPYILTTPFGMDYSLILYKKDTSYITVNQNFGIQYLFKGNNYIKVYVENMQSSLLSTEGLEFVTKLPSFTDFSSTLYGIEYHYTNLDYVYNPRKGIMMLSSAAAGNKTIKKNDLLKQELYEGLELKTTQYKIMTEAELYFPAFSNFALLFRTQSGYINNSNLFENELFRIGGLKTLRGFDEESITTSAYSILTFEFRYIFEQNSFMSLFWNGAYYEKKLLSSYLKDHPFGFGAGINFETKVGIFSLYYALGKQFDNPIDLKSSKIHFGITNVF